MNLNSSLIFIFILVRQIISENETSEKLLSFVLSPSSTYKLLIQTPLINLTFNNKKDLKGSNTIHVLRTEQTLRKKLER